LIEEAIKTNAERGIKDFILASVIIRSLEAIGAVD